MLAQVQCAQRRQYARAMGMCQELAVLPSQFPFLQEQKKLDYRQRSSNLCLPLREAEKSSVTQQEQPH